MTATPVPSRGGAPSRPGTPDLIAAATGVVVAALTAASPLAVQFGIYVINGFALTTAVLAAGLALFVGVPGMGIATVPVQRLLLAAAVAAFAAALLTLPFAVMNVDGRGLVGLGDGLARDVALRSGRYEGVLTRCAGAVMIVLALRTVGRPRLARGLQLAGAVLVVGSLLFTGHARTHGPLALTLTCALLHAVAAAGWFGGVVGLGVALRSARGDDAARLLAGFARWMTGVLVLLVAGGVGLALLCLSEPSGLVHTAYGQVLLVKLAVVGGVLVLSSANHRRLVPLAVRGRADAVSALRLNVAVEQIGLLAVVLITDVLMRQNPGG